MSHPLWRTAQQMTSTPRPHPRISYPMLNAFLLLISPPPVSPLLSFHPHRAQLNLSPSSPFSIFLTLYYSLPAHPYFCLPSIPCLPPTCLSLSLKVCHWKFRHAKNLTSFSIKLSSVSHPFLFLPFYQPRLSHPQHHCWSWILCSFQANVGNLPLLLPSLPILTLFHLTWLFTHWCSDAKVMNSQQNVVCFNWRTLEILQEETFFMVCVQHVFISVWLNVVTGASGAGKLEQKYGNMSSLPTKVQRSNNEAEFLIQQSLCVTVIISEQSI